MARPTKKPSDLVEKTLQYLDTCVDTTETVAGCPPRLKVSLPTIEGLSLYLGFNKTTLYEWEKIDAEFSNALSKVRTTQAQKVIENGLSGAYNPTIAKLILSSNHGMAEKTDNKHSGDQENPIIHRVERVIVKNSKD